MRCIAHLLLTYCSLIATLIWHSLLNAKIQKLSEFFVEFKIINKDDALLHCKCQQVYN